MRWSHYDHVGLLHPARTGSGGLRYYERAQLLRLQHILVLRELGLDEIGAVLDGGADEVTALRRHHRRLLRRGAVHRVSRRPLRRRGARAVGKPGRRVPGLAVYLRDAIAVYAAAHLD